MTTILLEYRFGETCGFTSDPIEYEYTLDDEEEKAYKKAWKLHMPLESFPELDGVLSDAQSKIEDECIEDSIEQGDEYVLECMGHELVDPDEINELVAERDEYTLEFFGLEEMSDEELDEWDANDLEELPEVCDFEEDFEPSSPFDGSYSISVEFAEHPEDEEIGEDEAKETLSELISEANGDYSVVYDYIERCENLFCGEDLGKLAEEVAKQLGYSDFRCE